MSIGISAIGLLFRSGWGWVTSHVRLTIEYLLIAVTLMLAGTVLYNRTRIAQAETRIVTLSGDLQGAAATVHQQAEANRQQDEAIAKLGQLRELDSQVITGLDSDLHKIGVRDRSIRDKLAKLEARNAQAKALLDTAVPADVGCVLDHLPTCPAGGHPHGGTDRDPQ